jgi:hypothetical protein
MHGFALGYLRHLRAFNFNESCSLAQLLYDFVSMLLKDDYESLTKLDKLEKAFLTAVNHLEIKAEADENLKEIQYFQDDVKKLRELYELFKADVKERIEKYRE